MKIVLIGGSGLIGRQTAPRLRALGHEVLSASPSSGVNTITGEGLADALAGAEVVVDVSNCAVLGRPGRPRLLRDLQPQPARRRKSRRRPPPRRPLRRRHRPPASERLLPREARPGKTDPAGGIPYTIVRATQFFEFVGSIAQTLADGNAIRVSSVLMQPILSDDVAAALADVALAAPLNGTVDIAGPDPIRMDELVRQYLAAKNDAREVITDPAAGYFGTPVTDQSLVPLGKARLAPTHFKDWLARTPS